MKANKIIAVFYNVITSFAKLLNKQYKYYIPETK